MILFNAETLNKIMFSVFLVMLFAKRICSD